MFDGIYGYFFGSNDTAQSTANLATDTTKDDWTFVDREFFNYDNNEFFRNVWSKLACLGA
jgi:hypothetical protein